MIRLSSLLLLLLLPIVAYYGGAVDGQKVEIGHEAIRKVEEFLTKNVPIVGDDVSLMMQKIGEKLKREDKAHVYRKRDAALVAGLKLINELRVIDGPDKCSERAYDILKRWDQLTEGQAHRKWSPLMESHHHQKVVHRIVHHYSLKRAQQCQQSYAEKYESLMKRGAVEDKVRDQVDPFMTRVILRQVCGYEPHHMDELDACGDTHLSSIEKLASVKRLTADDAVVITEELLLHSRSEDISEVILASGQSRRHHDVAMSKLKRLLEDTVGHSCRKFVEQVPAKLFAHAEYDALVLDRMPSPSAALSAFHVGWANYRLCRSLLADADTLARYVLDEAATNGGHLVGSPSLSQHAAHYTPPQHPHRPPPPPLMADYPPPGPYAHPPPPPPPAYSPARNYPPPPYPGFHGGPPPPFHGPDPSFLAPPPPYYPPRY